VQDRDIVAVEDY